VNEINWKGWRRPDIARRIDAFWQSSEREHIHRMNLAELCGNYAAPGDRVLEVGCGTGLVFEQLNSSLPGNMRYVGADLAMPMLDLAKARFPAADFLCTDGYQLPFKDRSFDLVVCFEVLGHIPEIKGLIGELLRVCAKQAIFTIWPAANGVIDYRQDLDGQPFLLRYYSHDYIMAQLAAAGRNAVQYVDIATIGSDCWAYVAKCSPDAIHDEPRVRRLFPVPANRRPGRRPAGVTPDVGVPVH